MRAVAVIPARYASTRLPGKPLLRESGKYLVQHVWEGVRQARGLSEVLIATDDRRILDAAHSFGARAVLTRPDHACGTDRVHEAARGLEQRPDVVLNVQGDEPGMGPEEIEEILRLLGTRPEADLATLAVEAGPEAGPVPSKVKVVTDATGLALYFSRSPIPFYRNAAPPGYLVHVGLYGYRMEALERFVSLPPSPLEKAESLEQLRALQAGLRIAVGRARRFQASVDTPEDYRAFLAALDPPPPAR